MYFAKFTMQSKRKSIYVGLVVSNVCLIIVRGRAGFLRLTALHLIHYISIYILVNEKSHFCKVT